MPALIQVFDPEDNYVATFKVKEGRPGGVAAVGSELFVTDVTGDRILVLDRGTGKLLRTFGSKGQGPGQFLFPTPSPRTRRATCTSPTAELPVSETGPERQVPDVRRKGRATPTASSPGPEASPSGRTA